MNIDRQTLVLAQWFSPAYPLGSFAWSHGIEAAVARGWVRDGASLQGWIEDILVDGSGQSDAVLIRMGFDANPSDLEHVDLKARAFSASEERQTEAARQGAAFSRTTAATWEIDLPDLMLPVALGRAARMLNLDINAVVPLYLLGFTSNLVAAAQRLLPLGQTEAQSILKELHTTCLQVSEQTQGATDDDLYSNAFLSDISAMTHETLTPRLFQS